MCDQRALPFASCLQRPACGRIGSYDLTNLRMLASYILTWPGVTGVKRLADASNRECRVAETAVAEEILRAHVPELQRSFPDSDAWCLECSGGEIRRLRRCFHSV